MEGGAGLAHSQNQRIGVGFLGVQKQQSNNDGYRVSSKEEKTKGIHKLINNKKQSTRTFLGRMIGPRRKILETSWVSPHRNESLDGCDGETSVAHPTVGLALEVDIGDDAPREAEERPRDEAPVIIGMVLVNGVEIHRTRFH